MPLINSKCSNCGSNIKIDSNSKKGHCEHCGAEYISEEIINNYQTINQYHTTQNIVKNIYGKESMDASDYIKNGDIFMSLGEFLKAEEAYIQAINTNPSDWRGWFGIVKIKTNNFTNLRDVTHLEYLEKAKKVATNEQLLEIEKQYQEFNIKLEKFKQYKESHNKKFQEEEQRLKQEKQAQYDLNKEKLQQKSIKNKKAKMLLFIFCSIFILISIIVTIIFLI